MKVFRAEDVEERTGSSYPQPFDEACRGRHFRTLASHGGLSQFGVNLFRLEPGAWSSQRHWHTHEDEFIYMLSGEAVLVTDEGEQVLRAGDIVCFVAGEANGHHMQNRSGTDCVFLGAGTCSDDDRCNYPDIDLSLRPGRETGPEVFTNKNDEPY